MSVVPIMDLPPPGLARMLVHEDHVVLERRAEVHLPAGVTRARLPGFEPGLDATRLRVRASSARILAVEAAAAAAPAGEAADEGRLHVLRAEIEGARALIALLDELAPGDAPGDFDPAAFDAATEHVLAHRAQAAGALAELIRALEAAERAPTALPPAGTDVILHLRATAPGPCAIELASEAGWGTWRPSHALHVEGGVVAVLGYADVWHPGASIDPATEVVLAGEGPPPAALAPPGQEAWVVRSDRPYEERSAELHRTAPPRPPRGDRLAPDAPPGPRPEGRFPRGAPSRSALGRIELGPGRSRVGLGAVAIEAALTYVLRPVVSPTAWGRLVVAPRGSAVLSEGTVELHVDGLHRARLALGEATRERPWRLDLGPEAAIVARREVRTELRVEGLLQREDVHVVELRFFVENGLACPARVRLEEAIPVAVDPRLRLRLVAPSPSGLEHDPKTGHVAVELELAPRGEARVELAYAIEAPHDYRLVQALGEGP